MDEDDWIKLIAGLIGIILALWLVGVILILIILTSPAWGCGVISGFIARAFARNKLTSRLKTPNGLSQVVTLSFDGFELRGQIDSKATQNCVKSYTHIPVIFCVIPSFAVYMAFLAGSHQFTDDTILMGTDDTIVMGIAIAVMTCGWCYLFWTRYNLTSAVEDHVAQALSRANHSFQTSSRLRNIIMENAHLARQLEIDFEQTGVNAIQAYIEVNKVQVISNPSSLQTVIATEIEKAKQDGIHLTKAIERFGEVHHLHQQASPSVIGTGSPSMVHALDLMLERLYQAKEICLHQREWNTFEEAMNLYAHDIKQLEAQAAKLTQGTRFTGEEPYRILGVNPEMTDNEIRKVFRDLCNIYHPDKGKVRADDKFKEITQAYNEIVNQRKG